MFPFGKRGVTYTKARGDFYCPSCARHRPYRRRRVRDFLTLARLPILPLDTLGEHIECDYCAATYQSEAARLELPHGEAPVQARAHAAVARVMVLMMIADGEIAPAELRTLQDIHARLTGAELSDQALAAELDWARGRQTEVTAFLSGLRAELNPPGRELVFAAAFFVATADGELRDQERVLLLKLSEALEITVGRYNDLLDEWQSSANRRTSPTPSS